MVEPTQSIYLLAAAGCAAVAAVTDLRSRRIPNWLTVPALAGGVLWHGLLGGWRGAGSSVLAMLVGGLLFFVFFAAGGMGAGDVKLMAALGALAGLGAMRDLLVLTALLGAALALGLAVLKGRLRETVGNSVAVLGHHQQHGLAPHPTLHAGNSTLLRLPYAVPMAAAALSTLLLHLHGGFSR